MKRTHQQRFLILLGAMLGMLLTATFSYMIGMRMLESQDRDFWQSLAWAAETLTTTGYGGDSKWSHPGMILFVVVTQFLGVVMVYMVVPIFLIPYLLERFEKRLPRSVPEMEDHVAVFEYSAAVESLLDELRRVGRPRVVAETDEKAARRLIEQGMPTVYGDDIDEALQAAGLDRADALVLNGDDADNATAVLIARQMGFEGEILALVAEPDHRQPIVLAGADAVYTPHHMLAAALAARASRRIDPRVSGLQQLGDSLQVVEVRIAPDSSLVGKTLAEARIGEITRTTVLAQWIAGDLVYAPDGNMTLASRGILIAVGRKDGLHRLAELAGGHRFGERDGPILIIGHGAVGAKIEELLLSVGEEVVTIDRKQEEHPDLVGDILNQNVLEEARIEEAQAIIVSLDRDAKTLFATLVLRNRNADVPIIARVNEVDNVERIYRAGADFALSISQVSGQVLARRLLRQEAVTLDPQLKVMKMQAPRLTGRSLAELRLRQSTRCSVVAVERRDGILLDLSRDLEFQKDDAIYVGGTAQDLQQFVQEWGPES